ncbi:MAG: DUF4912 domain-containing protein [Chthoniobacterales bacterium]
MSPVDDGNGENSVVSPKSDVPDSLYVVARDPRSLFIYWDVSWPRLFERAGLDAPRPVQVRVVRGDESVEATREINPFAGHTYIDVEAPRTDYRCELGYLDENEWKSLLRSGKTVTPGSDLSDDLSAQFATLPMHLTFQRLLAVTNTAPNDRGELVRSVTDMQASKRATPDLSKPQKFSKLLSAIAAQNRSGDAGSSDLAELLQAPGKCLPLVPEQLTRWQQIGESFGGASWTGNCPSS